MKTRSLMLAVKAMLVHALEDYPFPIPEVRADVSGLAGEAVSGEAPALVGKPAASDLKVFLHGLPDEQESGTYPFVCVRWVKGDINEGMGSAGCTETLALIIGVHAPQSQEEAGLLLAEALDWIRAALRRNRVVNERYQLNLPLSASIPDYEKRWNEFHMATVFADYDYVIPPTPLGEK